MARLSWPGLDGYITRWFTCPKAVTHPTTNQVQCRATSLIETNTLLLHLTAPFMRYVVLIFAVVVLMNNHGFFLSKAIDCNLGSGEPRLVFCDCQMWKIPVA